MSNPDHRRPTVKSSKDGFLHDLTHRLLPTCFFLHFLITGSVFFVYAVNQQPAPRRYATGASVAFGTLCGLYVLVFLVTYYRTRLANRFGLVLRPGDVATSTAVTPRDKRTHGQSGGFKNGLMERYRDLTKKYLISEHDKVVSEKVRRQGERERGQLGGHVPYNDHGRRVRNPMDGELDPYYQYEGTQSAYHRREQRPYSFEHHDDNNFQNVNLEAQNHQQNGHGPLPGTGLPIIDTICLEDQSPVTSITGRLPSLLYDHAHRFPPCPKSLRHVPSMSSTYAFNFDSTNANASVDLERGTIPPTPLPHPRPPATHWMSWFGRQRESQYSQQRTGCPTPPHSLESTRSSLEVLAPSTTQSGAVMSMPTLPRPIHTLRTGNPEKPGRITVALMEYYEETGSRPTPEEATLCSHFPTHGGAQSRRHAATSTATGKMQANPVRDKALEQTARSRVPVKSRLNKDEEGPRYGTVKWKKNAGRRVSGRHSKMGPPRSKFEDEDEGIAMYG